MVHLFETLLLLPFLVFLKVDLINIIHSLRVFSPSTPPDKDIASFDFSYVDFYSLITLIFMILCSIIFFGQFFVYLTLDVYFIPFNTNLNVLKKSDLNHALPFLKDTYFFTLTCSIWIIVISHEDLFIYVVISFPNTLLCKVLRIFWNLLIITHLVYARILYFTSGLLFFFSKKPKEIFAIILIWYTFLLLALSSDIQILVLIYVHGTPTVMVSSPSAIGI